MYEFSYWTEGVVDQGPAASSVNNYAGGLPRGLADEAWRYRRYKSGLLRRSTTVPPDKSTSYTRKTIVALLYPMLGIEDIMTTPPTYSLCLQHSL